MTMTMEVAVAASTCEHERKWRQGGGGHSIILKEALIALGWDDDNVYSLRWAVLVCFVCGSRNSTV